MTGTGAPGGPVVLCVDCLRLGQSRLAAGRERCAPHREQWNTWRAARAQAVHRGTHTPTSYGTYRPYVPRDTGLRGVVTLTERQLGQVDSSLAVVLRAKQPLDRASRSNTSVGSADYTPLLAAVEDHTALLNRLLQRPP